MADITSKQRFLNLTAWLNYAYLLVMMLVIAGILTAAMTLQYVDGELPCPLCLLERIALFGICFGIMQNFRHGFSYENSGTSMLFALFLLIVSARQSLLDIYPRPGHEYIGSAVFGLHMPVWSIVIALIILIAYGAKLAVLGGEKYLEDTTVEHFPVLQKVANIIGIYLIVICLINTVSVFLQCGLAPCHTFSYQLLQ